jgi:hypothetical protein
VPWCASIVEKYTGVLFGVLKLNYWFSIIITGVPWCGCIVEKYTGVLFGVLKLNY